MAGATSVKLPIKSKAKAISSHLPTSESGRADVNKSLERYYNYILELARIQIARSTWPLSDPEEEVNDLVQMTLIAFWPKLVSEKAQILCPNAYIRSIVRSRYTDLMRQRKHRTYLPLPMDQDGELYQGKALLMPGDGIQDPVAQYERKELIEEVIDDILTLPPCQQRAMICTLKDEVGDVQILEEAFRKRGLDISTVNWPE